MKNLFLISILALIITSCGSKGETVETAPFKEKPSSTNNFGNPDIGDGGLIKTEAIQPEKPVTEGKAIINYPSGEVQATGMMVAGKKDGLWQSYYKNGIRLSTVVFSSGVQNGETYNYYENGTLRYKGTFENGKKVGLWYYYTKYGNLDKQVNHSE